MKQKSESGSAHVVAIVCLVVALVVALGWIFYQNYIYQPPAAVTKTTTVVKTDSTDEPTLSQDIKYSSSSEPNGIELTSTDQIDERTDLSNDLKTFLKKTLSDYREKITSDTSCKDLGDVKIHLTIGRVYKQKYVAGGLSGESNCGSGGAAYIWADVDGEWKQVAGTQSYYKCDDLEKYSIPSVISGNKCMKSGGGLETYSQE